MQVRLQNCQKRQHPDFWGRLSTEGKTLYTSCSQTSWKKKGGCRRTWEEKPPLMTPEGLHLVCDNFCVQQPDSDRLAANAQKMLLRSPLKCVNAGPRYFFPIFPFIYFAPQLSLITGIITGNIITGISAIKSNYMSWIHLLPFIQIG